MIKNIYIKNVLSAIAVTVIGAILLNLTFILDWGFQSLIHLFFLRDYYHEVQWLQSIKHILFVGIILMLSWFVLKSRLNRIFKAAYFMVPFAVILVTVGMFSFRWQILSYSISILIYGEVILYLYHMKKNWLYYYSVTLIAALLLIMNILKMDI